MINKIIKISLLAVIVISSAYYAYIWSERSNLIDEFPVPDGAISLKKTHGKFLLLYGHIYYEIDINYPSEDGYSRQMSKLFSAGWVRCTEQDHLNQWEDFSIKQGDEYINSLQKIDVFKNEKQKKSIIARSLVSQNSQEYKKAKVNIVVEKFKNQKDLVFSTKDLADCK